MKSLTWTVTVNDCEEVMASEVGDLVREELEQTLARLEARGLPDVVVAGFGVETERK